MKKYLLSLVFIIGFFAVSNAQSYTYIAQRYDWLAGMFRALALPAGDGPADFQPGQRQRAGSVYYDSTGEDAGLYMWDGLAWVNVSGSTDTNLGNTDLTLTGPRAVSGAGNSLAWNNIPTNIFNDGTNNRIGYTPTNVYIVSPNGLRAVSVSNGNITFDGLDSQSDTATWKPFAADVSGNVTRFNSWPGSGNASLPVLKVDVLATGQSNMVNRDSTMGTWTYATNPKIIVAQDNGTWQMANPAANNISPQDVTAVVNKERNNIAFAWARNYLRRYPSTDSVRLIVSAKGGETSDKWTPKTSGAGEIGSGNFMLDSVVNKLNRAPADYNAKYILVHQGESDDISNITSEWINHWVEVYDTLIKHDKVDDNAIMVLGSFSTHSNYDSIRAAVDSLLYNVRNISGKPIYAANFWADHTSASMFDVTHFSNELIDRIGEAYFASTQGNFVDNQPGYKKILPDISASTTAQVYHGPLPAGFNTGDIQRWRAPLVVADVSVAANGTGTYVQLRGSSSVQAILRSYSSGPYQMNLNAGGLQLQGNINGQASLSDRYTLEASATPRIMVHNTSGTAVGILRGYLSSGVQISALLGAIESGVAGTTLGELWLHGNTSGTAKIRSAAAAGAPVFTLGTTTGILAGVLTNTATLDFASTAAGTVTDLTITVTGAALGDIVSIGVPHAAVPDRGSFSAWVSATNTVTVRYANNDLTNAKDPVSGTFRVSVTKF